MFCLGNDYLGKRLRVEVYGERGTQEIEDDRPAEPANTTSEGPLDPFEMKWVFDEACGV